jgi:CRISPR-associated protein Cas2
MRKTYLVTYDVRDDGRLRKVHKCMRNWGDHLQYSVFECQLNATELVLCKRQLLELIHQNQDQVLFVDLGPSTARGERVIEALGQPYTQFDSPAYIV